MKLIEYLKNQCINDYDSEYVSLGTFASPENKVIILDIEGWVDNIRDCWSEPGKILKNIKEKKSQDELIERFLNVEIEEKSQTTDPLCETLILLKFKEDDDDE